MDHNHIRVIDFHPSGLAGLAEGISVITKNQQIIYDLLIRIDRKVVQEMAHLDEITVEVHENTDVSGSAVLLLTDLAAKLEEYANDPAALLELAAELRASKVALADAVVANTPAAPVEPPVV